MATLSKFRQLYPTAMKKVPLAIAIGLLSYNASSYAADNSSYCLSAGSENNYACDKAVQIKTDQADIDAKLNELNRWLEDEEQAKVGPQSKTSQPTSADLRAKIETNSALLAEELRQAKVLQAKGNYQGAFDRVNTYLSSNPKDPNAWLLYGVSLMNQNKLTEASDIFSKLIQLYPDAPEPYNNLAAVYARQGNNEKAVETLLQAFETHPSYAQVQQNLKSVYAALATQAYNRALDLDNSQAPARARLAILDQVYQSNPIPQAVAAEPAAIAAAPVSSAPATAAAKPESTAPVAPAETAELVIEERDVSEGIVPVYEDENAVADTQQPESTALASNETVENDSPAVEQQIAEQSVSTVSNPTVEQSEVQPDAQEAEQVAAAAVKVLDDNTRSDIEQLINGWASAWSSQDVLAYLNYYAYGYSPSQEISHTQWRQGRNKRLKKPAFIKVTVSDISLAKMDDGRIRTVFRQDYRSNTYQDTVYKTLIFSEQQDGWKIAAETTL
ncbi:MAG: tetratricopeptide repeat protein [Amphritea sp.]|nr:tetratricopeptide repeat protein [Amphritea sp.]